LARSSRETPDPALSLLKAPAPRLSQGLDTGIIQEAAMPIPAALVRAIVVWLLLMAAETLLGGLRRLLVPDALAFLAQQVSVVVSVAMIFAISWLAAPWMRLRSTAQAIAIGLGWVALTLVFEIGLGRLIGSSWGRILADYDLRNGGLMPVGLVLMALTPWAVWRLRGRPARPSRG
jgi:hypothetical protein